MKMKMSMFAKKADNSGYIVVRAIHCILSICNIYLFSILVLRAGLAF